MSKAPVLIELDGDEDLRPQEAPLVMDDAPVPEGRAMQKVAAIGARKPSRLLRLFWAVLVSLTGFVASLAAWDYVNALLARSPLLGGIAAGLIAALIAVLAVLSLRELAAIGRIGRIDRLQTRAASAYADHDLTKARAVVADLTQLYAARDDTAWGRNTLHERQAEVFDADGLLGLAEDTLLAPLDARAQAEVEAAARQVATVTALVPLALADVFAALTANLRMIRRIAEIYSGRAGSLGSWRLARAVMGHLVATGAVAVGDDLLGSIASGSVLAKLSRRFGEGIVNGALTARVGIAAMEVCRPLPFRKRQRPSIRQVAQKALSGLLSRGG